MIVSPSNQQWQSSNALAILRTLAPVHNYDGTNLLTACQHRTGWRSFRTWAVLGVCVAMLLVGCPMRGYAQMQSSVATPGTGTFPDGVALNTVTNRIYVANQGSANVTVIDGAANTSTTVATGTNPHSVTVNSVTNKIYVANEGSGTVTVIDGDSNTTASVAVGNGPYAVALNSTTNKIYVANEGSGTVTVIDGATNAVTTVAVGNLPGAVAVNQVTDKIYVVNKCGSDPTCASAGSVTIIDGATHSTTTVAAGIGSGAVAVNPATNRIYVANSTSNSVTVIDGATNTASTVAVASPGAIALNEVTNQIYVLSGGNNVTVIDGATNDATAVAIGTEAATITVNPVTDQIYLLNPTSNTVTVIDGATNTSSTLPAGNRPIAVALNSATNQIYVAAINSNNVTMIDGITHNLTMIAVNPVANLDNHAIADAAAKSEEQAASLNTTIAPVPSPASGTPSFTFTAASSSSASSSGAENVYFQVDSLQGPWIAATRNGEMFTGMPSSPLSSGAHILYAYTSDGQGASSTGGPHGLVGQIAGKLFTAATPDTTGPLTSIVPNSALAGGPAFTLTVNGAGFVMNQPGGGGVQNSEVEWNGSIRATTFVNSTQLTAAITAADILNPGTAQVTVVLLTTLSAGNVPAEATPQPETTVEGVGSLTFTILAASSPVPTASSLSPSSATAGGAGFTLTVTGTNFVSNSVVQWNGAALVTTFGSATQLTAAVPAGDIATAGTASVTVFTPTPGGGTSGALTFTINAAANNPVPTLSALQPSSATAGAAGFTLTVTGTNFISTSSVKWNGATLVTTFGSATQLTAAVPATDIATAGTASVTVFNGTPGGGTSAALTFTINAAANNPVPTVSALSPSSATAGGAGFMLMVMGTNFVSNSVVQWNGAALTTTFGSATQLTAAVPQSDIATAGTASVTVFNPTPGGGTSSALMFTINASTNNPVPTLTGLQPSTISAGAAVSLTVTGTNFISTSVVKLNGTALATTFTSATQLMASVPAAAIPTAGTASVTVFNPTPVGGTSSGSTVTIVGFSLPNPPAPQTVMAGQSANFTIPTAPAGAAPATMLTPAASGLPMGASASFLPSPVTPGTSTVMTVATTSRRKSGATHEQFDPRGNKFPGSFPAGVASLALAMMLAALGFAGLPRKPLQRFAPVVALLLLILTVGYLSACGGSSSSVNPNGTPAGSFTIKVTMTSTAGALSTNVTLNVQ